MIRILYAPNILALLLLSFLLISCNNDDDNVSESASPAPGPENTLTPGAAHTYEIEVTTGTFAGMTFSGTVANEDASAHYNTFDNMNLASTSFDKPDISVTANFVRTAEGIVDLGDFNTTEEDFSTISIDLESGALHTYYESVSGTVEMSGFIALSNAIIAPAAFKVIFNGTFAASGFPEDTAQISGTFTINPPN